MRPHRIVVLAAWSVAVLAGASSAEATSDPLRGTGTSGGLLRPSAPAIAPFAESNGRTVSRSALERSAWAYAGPRTAAAARRSVARLSPSLASDQSMVPDEAKVKRILGPTAVQLEGKGGEAGGAVVSNWPVAVPPSDGSSEAANPVAGSADRQTGSLAGATPGTDPIADLSEWSLIDLTWRAGDRERLGVVRAPMELSLPKSANGTARVGELGARLAPTASASSGGLAGETVTYPDVATDTDLVVRSLPVGLQAGWHVRSPNAPTKVRVPLDIPAGLAADVAPSGDVVMRDAAGRVRGSIRGFAADDAAGRRVPVEATLEGSTLVLDIDHQQGETMYPLVVAPVFNFYFVADWRNGDVGESGWREVRSSATAPFDLSENFTPGDEWWSGLSVHADQVSSPAGLWAAWALPAPGDQGVGTPGSHGRTVSPEHAYWTSATIGGIDYYSNNWVNQVPPRGTIAFARPLGGWGDWTGIPQQHDRFAYPSTAEYDRPGPLQFDYDQGGSQGTLRATANVPGNAFVSGLRTTGQWETSTTPPNPGQSIAIMNFSWYFLRTKDNVNPAFTVDPLPNWLSDGDVVQIRATDRGTGVASIQLGDALGSGSAEYPPEWDGEGTARPPFCPVNGDMLCDFEAGQAFSVEHLPEGRRPYEVLVQDGGERTASQNISVGVDRSGPEVVLSGSLYVDRATEVVPADPPRPLTVSATDGNPSGGPGAQRSGVQRVEIYVDDELVHEADQAVAGDSQPLSTTWTPDAETFTSGEYVVRVEVTDRLGNEESEEFIALAPCCATPLEDATVPVGDRISRFGDVDGDGRADAILVNDVDGGIAVRLGRGDGTFGAEQSWGTFGVAVQDVAVGNVDGEDDAITAGTADLVAQSGSGTVLMLSDGSEFVAAPAPIEGIANDWGGSADYDLHLADVDGDGSADLWGQSTASGALWVAAGSPAGFLAKEELNSIPGSRQVHLADLDGDGAADLVTYEPSDGTVRYHESTGDGFGATETWGLGPVGATVVTGDVNGDGMDDMVFRVPGSGGSPDSVVARVSSTDGEFASGTRDLGSLDPVFALQVVDLTGDGADDVVGTRMQGTDLLVRSAASSVPVSQAPDTTPIDVDSLADGSTAGLVANATTTPNQPVLMAQDDNALLYGGPLGASVDDPTGLNRRRDQLLTRLKYLGVKRVRLVLYWGQVDRLHPQSQLTAEGTDGFRRIVGAVDSGGAATDDFFEGPMPQGGRARLRDRYVWGQFDSLIERIAANGMTVHLTITGGTKTFTECNTRNPLEEQLMVRGCRRASQAEFHPTGVNPSPAGFAHFVSEAVQHFRSLPGAPGKAVTSVGIYNEPNLTSGAATPSTFLASVPGRATNNVVNVSTNKLIRAGSERSAAELYGKLYAASYAELEARGLLARAGSQGVQIAFGEMSSSADKVNVSASSDKRRTERPEAWLRAAVAAAKAYQGSGSVRADGLAVHPYQHPAGGKDGRPDQASGEYPFGVHGLGTPRKKGSSRSSVVGTLKSLFDGNHLKNVRADRAPEIWATEFGYYNTKHTTVSYKAQSKTVTESTRAKFLKNSKGRRGALSAIVQDSKATILNLYQVVEAVPVSVVQPAKAPPGQPQIPLPYDDYGFIGAIDERAVSTGFPNGYRVAYTCQLLALEGQRAYGRSARSPASYGKTGPAENVARAETLSWVQPRRTAAAVRAWAAARGGRLAPSGAKPVEPRADQDTCSQP